MMAKKDDDTVKQFTAVHDHVQRFIDGALHGEFSINDVCRYFGYADGPQRQIVDYWLRHAVIHDRIERTGKRWGWFRRKEDGLEKMNFVDADPTPVPLWLPFHLSEKVRTFESNVIVVAGSPNSGKSAFCLNVIKENMHLWDVHLFDSESDAGELRTRLENFLDISIDQWRFSAYKRTDNFHDVIFAGPGNLNVIDFLEIHDEFYQIGAALKKIKDTLRGAVAIVGLQKNPGQMSGLGGQRSLEVARLAIGLDKDWPFNRCTILKAKHRIAEESIDDCFCEFKLVSGSRFIPADKIAFRWHRPSTE